MSAHPSHSPLLPRPQRVAVGTLWSHVRAPSVGAKSVSGEGSEGGERSGREGGEREKRGKEGEEEREGEKEKETERVSEIGRAHV